MSEVYASAEDLHPLYELMAKIKEMAPWQWLDEVNIFGVQRPDTQEVGFVSVMGALGEHLAIAVYRGTHGLYGLLGLQEKGGLRLQPEDVLAVPQLQASLEGREMVDKRDREIMKQLGLKFRGAQGWTLFRSYRPGFMPWHVTPDEARMLRLALEQTLEVAPCAKKNRLLLEPTIPEHFMVRVQEDGKWRDITLHIPPPPLVEVPYVVDPQLLESAKQLPKRDFTLEADLFMIPGGFRDKGERPYFGFMLLVVEPTRGFPLCAELLQPLPSMDALYEQLPNLLLKALVETQALPIGIRVRSDVLDQQIKKLAREVGFKTKHTSELRVLDQMRASLMGFMGR